MKPHDLTDDDQLLRDRLRTLALPIDAVPQWDDVCRRTTHRQSFPRPRLWRPLVAAATLLCLAGAAAAIADAPLPNLPWQGDARPGYHVGEIQALTNMAVFKTPRVPADELPSEAASAFREFTANRPGLPDGLLPGTALLAQSRLLLSDIGPRLSRLYVSPPPRDRSANSSCPKAGAAASAASHAPATPSRPPRATTCSSASSPTTSPPSPPSNPTEQRPPSPSNATPSPSPQRPAPSNN